MSSVECRSAPSTLRISKQACRPSAVRGKPIRSAPSCAPSMCSNCGQHFISQSTFHAGTVFCGQSRAADGRSAQPRTRDQRTGSLRRDTRRISTLRLLDIGARCCQALPKCALQRLMSATERSFAALARSLPAPNHKCYKSCRPRWRVSRADDAAQLRHSEKCHWRACWGWTQPGARDCRALLHTACAAAAIRLG